MIANPSTHCEACFFTTPADSLKAMTTGYTFITLGSACWYCGSPIFSSMACRGKNVSLCTLGSDIASEAQILRARHLPEVFTEVIDAELKAIDSPWVSNF
jgi:hypothetical protein